MAPVSSTQRLVPIRPSPLKSGVAQDTIVINTVSCSTITMKTGAKRKLADNLGNHEGKCKRLNTGNPGNKSSGPSTMGRRNARERNRVKQVNNSFLTLRQHVPGASKSKKISKVETLKQATDYIRSLQILLDEHDAMLAQNESQTSLPSNSQISNVSSSNVQAQYIQHSPVLTTPMLLHPKQENCSSVSTSIQSNTIYPDYYYSENISPISPTGYPMNLQTVHRENLSVSEQTTFKAEVNFLPSESYNTQEQQQQQNIIVSYPNTPTPITPVSQLTFSLTQQSPSYEIATTVYPTTITYSPNSMATQSPHSSISPTGSTYQHSPISSPSAASVAPTSSQFSPSYPRAFSDECGKPSLIGARNFIIPAEELPYCLPPGITTLQIEQATATTKADLDLLDAISLWQDS